MNTQTFKSKDGKILSYHYWEHGSSLLMIPGAIEEATNFPSLAEKPASHFTVFIIDRRGKGQSGSL